MQEEPMTPQMPDEVEDANASAAPVADPAWEEPAADEEEGGELEDDTEGDGAEG